MRVFQIHNNSVGKESTCNAGDHSLISGSGKSAVEGIGYPLQYSWAFLVGSAGKESACKAGGPSLFPGSGRSPEEGIGYPLQYSWASLDLSRWMQRTERQWGLVPGSWWITCKGCPLSLICPSGNYPGSPGKGSVSLWSLLPPGPGTQCQLTEALQRRSHFFAS